jgi:AcrR family transcriptional regulator
MQARAAATVDTLFEAAARILESGDAARLTTNRIAERAGFSIGTLYGYFPNKRGLLRAMALREARRQQVHVLAALDEAGPDACAEDMVRIVVRAALRPFGRRHRLRTAMMKLMMDDHEVVAAADTAQEQVVEDLLRAIMTRSNGVMAEIGADTFFTLRAAVTGAISAAASQRPELIETQSFEDDIVRLVMAFALRR